MNKLVTPLFQHRLKLCYSAAHTNENENERKGENMTYRNTTHEINALIIDTLTDLDIDDCLEVLASYDLATDEQICEVIDSIDSHVPLCEKFDHWVSQKN